MDKEKYKKFKTVNVISGIAVLVFAYFFIKGVFFPNGNSEMEEVVAYDYSFILMLIAVVIYLSTFPVSDKKINSRNKKEKKFDISEISKKSILWIMIILAVFILQFMLLVFFGSF